MRQSFLKEAQLPIMMYCEDTSTSSEDEASTTGTAARSRTTKTADMCRVVVRNGERFLGCTGCGYTSDRRANVTRHYERIHCVLQAEKYRECPCGKVFRTKWAFYNHCDEHHPSLRQSSYTTNHVYKLKQTKSRSKCTNKPYALRQKSSKRPEKEAPIIQLSPRRLRSQRVIETSSTTASVDNHNSSTIASSESGDASDTFSIGSSSASSRSRNDSASSSSSIESSSASFRTNDDSACDNPGIEWSAPMSFGSEFGCNITPKKKEFFTPFQENAEYSCYSHLRNITPEKKEFFTPFQENAEYSCYSHLGNITPEKKEFFTPFQENAEYSCYSHLPIKKRYLQSARRVFGDITNRSNNVEVQKVNYSNDNNNNISLMSALDLYLANIDEKQRAFISHIDFDELDAILKLRDMQKTI